MKDFGMGVLTVLVALAIAAAAQAGAAYFAKPKA